jgi:hypothetical protein
LFRFIGKCITITIYAILQIPLNLKSHNIITIYNKFSQNPRPLSVLAVTFPITFFLILTFSRNSFCNSPTTKA